MSILLSSLRRDQSMGRVRSFSNDVSEDDKKKLMNLTVPLPHRENERLMLLRECQILDSPAEESYDRFTFMSARIFKVPISVISLVDVDRQWFKARVGLSVSETHRDLAFCSHCILEKTERILLVNDALQDPRFAQNPLVIGYPFIRFYAGASLLVDGIKVGTLCIIDTVPWHTFTIQQQKILIDLADTLSEMMTTRRRAYLDQQYQGIKIQQSVLTMIQSPLSDLQESFHTLQQVKKKLKSSSWQSKESFVKELLLLDEKVHNFNSEMLYFEQLLDLSLRSLSNMISQKQKHKRNSFAKPQQIQLYSSSFSAPTITENVFHVVHLSNSEQHPQPLHNRSVQLRRSMDIKYPVSSPKHSEESKVIVTCNNDQSASMLETNFQERVSGKGNPEPSTNLINITDTVILILATLITHVVEVQGNVIAISLPNELPAAVTETSPLLFIQLQCQFPSSATQLGTVGSSQEMKEISVGAPTSNENSGIDSDCAQSVVSEKNDANASSLWIDGVISSPLMDTVALLLSSVFGTVVFHPQEHFFGLEIPLSSSSVSFRDQSLEDMEQNDLPVSNTNNCEIFANRPIKASWQQFVELEKIEFSIEELAKVLSAHPHFQGSFSSISTFSTSSSAVAVREPPVISQNASSIQEQDFANSLADTIKTSIEPLVDAIVKSASPSLSPALSPAVMTTIAPLLTPQLSRLSPQLSRANSHKNNIHTNSINNNVVMDSTHSPSHPLQHGSPAATMSRSRTTSMHNVVVLSDEAPSHHLGNKSIDNPSNNNSVHFHSRHRTLSNDHRDRSDSWRDVTQGSNRSDSFTNQRLTCENSKTIQMKMKAKPSPRYHNLNLHTNNNSSSPSGDAGTIEKKMADNIHKKVDAEDITAADDTLAHLQIHEKQRKKKNSVFDNIWQRLFPMFSSNTQQVVCHSDSDGLLYEQTESNQLKKDNVRETNPGNLIPATTPSSTGSQRVVS